MSIEKSSVASTPKVAGHGGAGNALGKTDRSKAADAAGAGGFAALLTSIDEVDTQAQVLLAQASDAVATADSDTSVFNGFLQSQLTPDFTPGPPTVGSDGGYASGSTQPGTAANNLQADPLNGLLNLNTELASAPAVVSQSQLPFSTVGASGVQPPAPAAETVVQSAKNAPGKHGLDTMPVAQKADPLMSLAVSLQDAVRRIERPVVEGAIVPFAMSGKLQAAGSGLGAAGQQAGKNAHSSDGLALSAFNTLAVTLAGFSGEARGQGSDTDRAPPKSFTQALTQTADGAWAQHSGTSEVQFSSAPSAPDPSAFSPDVYVAEQVSYWVSKDVQNAQLKLDGFGSEPVEVSISMRGNEAIVDFRSDQPEVRQVLESAASHLKEMLSRQGMVLSGVSVGTSSQDASGSQQRKNQAAVRQTKVEMLVSAAAPAPSRMARATGNALDLFV